MSRTGILGSFVLVVAGLSGCASPAKIIQHDANQVVVAIPDNTNSWPYYYREAATKAAAQTLPGAEFVSETRVKVGQQTTSTIDSTRHDIPGGDNQPRAGEVASIRNSTSVSDNYEWHIVFRKQNVKQVPDSILSATKPPPSNGRPLTPVSGNMPPIPAVTPASGTNPPNPAPVPATDVKPPFNPPPSPATSIPSTLIPGPGQGGR